MKIPKIDESLFDGIPALQQDELEQLEQNILADGRITNPLIVWKEKGLLVSGRNRAAIAAKHKVDFQVVEKSFASEEEVRNWIADEALGQRNMSRAQISILRGMRAKRTGVAETAERYGVNERAVYRDLEVVKSVEALAAPIKMAYESAALKMTAAELHALAAKAKAVQLDIARKSRTTGKTFAELLKLKPKVDTKTAESKKAEAKKPETKKKVVEEKKSGKVGAAEINARLEEFAKFVLSAINQAPSDPWMDKGRREMIADHLKSAAETARAIKCAECPACEGEGCAKCRQVGYLPKQLAEAIVSKKKQG